MHRLIRAALASLVLALVTSSSGCSFGSFDLRLVDFESISIDGIRLWRFENGAWQPDLAIRFQGVVNYKGEEYLSYRFDTDDVEPKWEIVSPIDRDGRGVALQFVFVPIEEGEYKISAFNDAGESGLSQGTYSL